MSVVRDVSERKRAEETLSRNLATLARSQEIGHIGSWALDFETGAFEASDEDYRIYGLVPGSSALLDLVWTLIHPDDLDRYHKYVESVQREGRLGGIDYRIVRPDGAVRHVYAETANVVRGADGRVRRASGITQDVTDRKLAELEVLERARLSDALSEIDALVHSALDTGKAVEAALSEGAAALGASTAVVTTRLAPEPVGGDFSDVFVIDDTRVVVLVGDVAGKGVHAAGMTETVRSTVRALASVDPSPAFILAKANELLLRFDPDEPHVTAFCAVLDPHTGHLSYASAGHPAPIHVGPFSARPLDVTFGPPLGSFDLPYRESHAMLTLEDYLVLYTDGVTEARRDGKLYGEARVVETVANLRDLSAQELAEGLLQEVGNYADKLADDIQIVTLRLA